MAFYHGVEVKQIPTSIIPPRQISASIPVFVGCAPIHRLANQNYAAKNGEVVLCHNNAAAVRALGYTANDNFEKWGLSEAAYTMFVLYACAPAVFINIFDPNVHKKTVANESVTLTSFVGKLEHDDIIQCVLTTDDGLECRPGIDYSLNQITGKISISKTGILNTATSVNATYTYAAPELVTTNECIGGVDLNTNKTTGIQLVDRVFTQYRVLPGVIVAPGFSDDPSVAAIMATKAGSINGIFRAVAVADLPKSLTDPTLVPEYKIQKNLVQEDLIVCWPRAVFNNQVMRLSTLTAGVIARTDADHDDVPYVSPSNELLQMQAATADGFEELWLSLDEANYLNSNGIVTSLNFIGGWKLWGNRTACYPDVTDIKDTIISNRRMFAWYGNQLILTWWQKVDEPIGHRLAQTIMNSEQINLNSYTAKGYILGGRIEFLESENSTLDLMDGMIQFHINWGTQSPAERIKFSLEYDPDYLSTLFG